MTTAKRILGFLATVVATFTLALGIGRTVGPVGDAPSDTAGVHHGSEDPISTPTTREPTGSPTAAPVADLPGGLMVSQAGYTLRMKQTQARSGRTVPLSFTVEGPDGGPVTAYEVEHDKQLHLIAVRRDMSGFQHVHPVLGTGGVWSTSLALSPGQWRLFADFKPSDADPLTLGTDLAVAGDYQPVPDRGASRMAGVAGYRVTVEGDLVPGTDSRLTLTVTRDGKPVTDLQPYLGSYGHLVALRDGDLAYLHVHPEGTPGDRVTDSGPSVVFYASVPSVGRYHLFLNFQHDSAVRTAPFVLDAA